MIEEYLEEFDEENEQYNLSIICNCCLSGDRNLYCIKNIGDLNEIFQWIMDGFPGMRSVNHINGGGSELFVCWECQALLKRFAKFKRQVHTAQDYIQGVAHWNMQNSQDHTYTTKCLSSLDVVSKATFDNVFVNISDLKQKHEVLIVSTKQPVPAEYLLPTLAPKMNPGLVIASSQSSVVHSKVSNVNVNDQYNSSKRKNTSNRIKLNPIKVEKSSHYVVERMTEEEMCKVRELSKQEQPYANAEYRCMLCILGFNNKHKLEEHFTSAHSAKPGQVPCTICQMWMDEATLKKHIDSHYYRYMCKHCARVEIDLRVMRKHLRTHVPKRTDSNIESKSKGVDSDCSAISEDFPHPGSRKTRIGHKCNKCDITFETLSMRRIHMYRQHSKRVICDHCKKQFANKTSLMEHIKGSCIFLHPGQAPQEKCPICQKMIRAMYLKGHMRRHETNERYECKQCNKTFSHSYTYKGHFKYSRAHITDFKYRCPMCKKGYLTKGAMQDHFNYHHLGSTLHKCTICDKALATRRSVIQHMRQVHIKDDRKPNICNYCGKAFRMKRRMQEHERTHTNEKPLACDICGSRFRQASSLYTHKRRVHNLYPIENTSVRYIEEIKA